MANWEKLCPVSEVPPGSRKVMPMGMWNVLVFNTGNRYFACNNECPHLGEPLEKGEIAGHVVRCGAHGYKMDLTNGKCLTEAGLDLAIFPVEIRDNWIWIKI